MPTYDSKRMDISNHIKPGIGEVDDEDSDFEDIGDGVCWHRLAMVL